MKVIHGPLNMAGQTYLLSQALRAEGIDSISYRIRAEWDNRSVADVYGYKDDRVFSYGRDNRLGDLFRFTQEIIAEKPDIVHLWHRPMIYMQHGGIFNGIDVPFFQLGGARVAMRFTGYELRRKSLEMKINPYSPYRYSNFDFGFPEDEQNRFYDFLDPYVDAFVVQDPEMQTYCPQARIIPRVLELEQFPVVDRKPNARPMVVHAPTLQHLKGSQFVLKAVEELKSEGLAFDFQLIEKMPNAEAIERYRAADVVIDQILIGWYGVLAMETMAMGKAVIAYIRDDLTGYFGGNLPLLNANPDTIKDVLRQAIKDGELRKELGRRARAWMETTHDSRLVARDLKKLYEEMLAKPRSARVPDFSYQIPHGSTYFMANTSDETFLRAVRRVPSTSVEELVRKVELLAKAGTLAEVERKLGVPSTSTTVIQTSGPPGALSEFERVLLKLVRRIPAETTEQLERKDRFLKLLLQVPAKTAGQLERKIATLIPPKQRAAAIAEEVERLRQGIVQEKEHFAQLQDSYFLGLAHHIPAANPQELEAKITSLIQGSVPPGDLIAHLVGWARRILSRESKKPREASLRAGGPVENERERRGDA